MPEYFLKSASLAAFARKSRLCYPGDSFENRRCVALNVKRCSRASYTSHTNPTGPSASRDKTAASVPTIAICTLCRLSYPRPLEVEAREEAHFRVDKGGRFHCVPAYSRHLTTAVRPIYDDHGLRAAADAPLLGRTKPRRPGSGEGKFRSQRRPMNACSTWRVAEGRPNRPEW
jgi:hypothetical protein